LAHPAVSQTEYQDEVRLLAPSQSSVIVIAILKAVIESLRQGQFTQVAR
jgi:hypothetical protein